jgi:DNA polymerase
MQFVVVDNFDEWRATARQLLTARQPPEAIHWSDPGHPQLFAPEVAKVSGDNGQELAQAPISSDRNAHRVPPEFIEQAKVVACHRGPERWELLYRLLWRLVHGERSLLQISTDDDVFAFERMRKEVTRDVHKMKAFVRFRLVHENDHGNERIDGQSAEAYVAWHRPDHRIVRLAAPFFARRFPAMHWTIFTPDESVHWNQSSLQYGPGTPANPLSEDAIEDLWRTYYAAIFNPARTNPTLMKREMPVRHWPTLPEAQIIPDLLVDAKSRTRDMVASREGFASDATSYIPHQADLPTLAVALQQCQACDLACSATQAVAGEGSAAARMVIVGEQPGDEEDRVGRPFVGPAGKLLDSALLEAGIDRQSVYLTNVVKHFKFVARGKQRLHKTPQVREITACRPWLAAELETIRPNVVVCLGSTAAQAMLGRDFRVRAGRGQWFQSSWNSPTSQPPRVIATWHPAAILRMQDPERRESLFANLVDDLMLAAAQVRNGPS